MKEILKPKSKAPTEPINRFCLRDVIMTVFPVFPLFPVGRRARLE